jgi:hypothetical protein
VPKPPLERPRAWSVGSFFGPPFSVREQRRGWHGWRCYRATTVPNQADLGHQVCRARTPTSQQSGRPDTSADSDRGLSSRGHSAREYHAIGRRCAASKTGHSGCGDGQPRMAASSAWLWQIGFEQQILLISQFVSAHQHISFLHADTLLLQIVCHRYQVPGQNLE